MPLVFWPTERRLDFHPYGVRPPSPPQSRDDGAPQPAQHHRPQVPNDNMRRVLNRAVKREDGNAGESGEETHKRTRRDRRGKKSFSEKEPRKRAADDRTNLAQPQARNAERNEPVETEIVKEH